MGLQRLLEGKPAPWPTLSKMHLHFFKETPRVLVGGVGAISLALNKGDNPRVPIRVEMKIYRMSVHIDLGGLSCSGILHSDLHWALNVWRLLVWMGFGRAHLWFYLTVFLQREHHKALLVVTIRWHNSSFHGEVR
jgi:hypothetical protein